MIEGFHNFLAQPAAIMFNATVDKNGVATFDIELDSHSTLLIVASNENQCAHIVMPVSKCSGLINKRDLSLLKAFNQDVPFSEVRRTANVLKSQTFMIEDITSTELQYIDSLDKVWRV